MKTRLRIALLLAALGAALPVSARAHTLPTPAVLSDASATLSAGSLGGANLLSEADSDFESWTGNWTGVVNATMSQDMSHQFLHDGSALISISGAGAGTVVLGGVRLPVTGGDTYRIDGFFKAPDLMGLTQRWGLSFFDTNGANLGGVTWGATHPLDPATKWQFTTDDISAPSGAAYVGSVRIVIGGASGPEGVNVDEVTLAPRRAATLIGARATGSTPADFTSTDATIGPLQITKMFNKDALPATFGDTECAGLPAGVTCIITWKTLMDTASLQAFVQSIPSNRNPVFLVFFQEPEGNSFSYNGLTGGPAFVAEFENQVGIIRAAGDNPRVYVAMDAGSYQYDVGSNHANGADCSFIPPTTSADLYLLDHYQNPAIGKDLANEGGAPQVEWETWLGCVKPQGKPIGLGEYGLNCGPGSPDDPTTARAIAADSAYLAGLPVSGFRTSGNLNAPVIAWDYWYHGTCVFTGPAAIDAWHAAETMNGGG